MPPKNQAVSSLKTLAGILTSCGVVLAGVQAYSVLPYRVEQAEKGIMVISRKADLDHDLLIQISRDLQYVKEELQRRNKPSN